jgi:LPS export ABC transporter protein LptC
LRYLRILTAVAAVLFAFAPAEAGARKGRVRQKIKGFKLPRYEDGKLVWKVVCGSADILDSKEMRLQDPKLHIVPAKGKPGYDIRAREGHVTSDSKTISFSGDVRMMSTDGDTLETNSMTWKTESETALSDDPIEIRRKKMRLSGVGLTAQAKSRDFRIHKKAGLVMTRDKLKPGQKGVITVVSEGSLTFKGSLAAFAGRSTVKSDTGTTTSDRLDLHLDMKSESVEKAVATGNVLFTSAGITGRSRRAEWAPSSDTIQLSGKVDLKDAKNGNTVQSERARISSDSRRMSCPGPAVLTVYPEKTKGVK